MKRLLLLTLLALAACAPAVQPVPAQIPDPKSLEAIEAQRMAIAGFDEPNTPNEFDKAFFVRYSVAKTTKARAVVVLMPGFLGGAANFDRLARSMVAKDPSLEVWAIDRRSNQLEDHSRLQEALTKRNPRLAWEYHFAPNGFVARDPKSLKFMGFWGLQVHLEDLRRVATSVMRPRSSRWETW